MTRTTPRILLVAGLALTTACAGLEPGSGSFAAPAQPRALDARLMVGNMGARNSYELRNQPAEPRPAEPRADAQRRRPVTPILFWLGIGMTAVGGAGAVATGAAAFATQRQLANGYDDNVLSADARTLQDRGEALNKATIAGAVIAVVGALLAITVYGHDYTHCGPLAPKQRRETAPPGRCPTADAK